MTFLGVDRVVVVLEQRGAKNMVKNKTNTGFLLQSLLSGTLLPQFSLGLKTAIKKEAKIFSLGPKARPHFLYVNTVIGLGQGEELLLLNSHVNGPQIPLFPAQLLHDVGVRSKNPL